MARRSGKASSRRSRQRRSQQTNRPAGPRPASQPAPDASEELVTASDVGGTSAFDKADAEVRAASAAAPTLGRAAAPRRAATTPRITATGPSALGERAAAEYHYVRQDLRNIAVLVVAMAVLLAIATVLVNVLNIGPG